MKTKTTISLIPLLSLLGGITPAAPLGTAFTYQGRLTDGANAANGGYDLRFAIYDAVTNGTLKAVVTNASVAVTNGLFTTPVDFGSAPNNANAVWLEIAVRTNGSAGGFTAVSPRQAVLPAPYAFYALMASNSVLAGTASNVIPDAISSASIQTGSIMASNINTASLSNSLSGEFWSLGGNSGTTAGVNFIGTTDNQALELKANGSRALRLEPNTNGAPNVIGGSPINGVASGTFGSVIAGGGVSNYYGSSYSNSIGLWANLSAIGGGCGNSIYSGEINATLAGGYMSGIGSGTRWSVWVGSDVGNTISGGGGNYIYAHISHIRFTS